MLVNPIQSELRRFVLNKKICRLYKDVISVVLLKPADKKDQRERIRTRL